MMIKPFLSVLCFFVTSSLHGCGSEENTTDDVHEEIKKFRQDVAQLDAAKDSRSFELNQAERLAAEEEYLKKVKELRELERLEQERVQQQDRPKVEEYVTVEVPEIVNKWHDRDSDIQFECTVAEWESGKPIFREGGEDLFVYRRHVKFIVEYNALDSKDVKTIELHRLLPHNIMNQDTYKVEVVRDDNGDIQRYEEYFRGPSFLTGRDEVWYKFVDLPDNQMDLRRNWQSAIMTHLKQGMKKKQALKLNAGGEAMLVSYPESTHMQVCEAPQDLPSVSPVPDTHIRAATWWLKKRNAGGPSEAELGRRKAKSAVSN